MNYFKSQTKAPLLCARNLLCIRYEHLPPKFTNIILRTNQGIRRKEEGGPRFRPLNIKKSQQNGSLKNQIKGQRLNLLDRFSIEILLCLPKPYNTSLTRFSIEEFFI